MDVLVLVAVRIDLDTAALQENAHKPSERVEVQYPVPHAERTYASSTRGFKSAATGLYSPSAE